MLHFFTNDIHKNDANDKPTQHGPKDVEKHQVHRGCNFPGFPPHQPPWLPEGIQTIHRFPIPVHASEYSAAAL